MLFGHKFTHHKPFQKMKNVFSSILCCTISRMHSRVYIRCAFFNVVSYQSEAVFNKLRNTTGTTHPVCICASVHCAHAPPLYYNISCVSVALAHSLALQNTYKTEPRYIRAREK